MRSSPTALLASNQKDSRVCDNVKMIFVLFVCNASIIGGLTSGRSQRPDGL
jgi:hypothetical protein